MKHSNHSVEKGKWRMQQRTSHITATTRTLGSAHCKWSAPPAALLVSMLGATMLGAMATMEHCCCSLYTALPGRLQQG